VRAQAEAIAAAEARREELAFGARQAEIAMLVALGAVLRPPMPPAVDENPGEAPSAGETWVGGHWEWSEAQWVWEAGFWTGGRVTVDLGVVVDGARAIETHARDHRHDEAPPPPPSNDRDHRDERPAPTPTPTPTPTNARDHRVQPEESSPPPRADDNRDHRSSDTGNSRDHRH
jgi:hypothetical protein